MDTLRRITARILECIGGVALLIAVSPFFLIATLLVLFDLGRPVFYLQERYGKDKKVFLIYKFRTMRVGSESGKPIWGKEVDSRASSIGNFLRKTHLDELPQLLNMLQGQMSLVGPRPERPYFADLFEDVIVNYAERYKVRPGITGWAQVHGYRGDSCVEERARYDAYYVRNRSFALNVFILFMTPFAHPVRARKMDAIQGITAPHKSTILAGKRND